MIPSSAYIAVGQYLLKKSREHDLNIDKKEKEKETETDTYGDIIYNALLDLCADEFIDFVLWLQT